MSPSAEGRDRVAFVLKGYPRLSETFIAQEILGARAARARDPDRLAAPADRPRDPSGPSPIRAARALSAGISLPASRAGSGAAGWRARRLRAIAAARRAWLADLRRDPTPNRVRRFGQALVLAAELAGRRRSAARAFPAHPGLGRALCGADRRPRLDGLGARQGHLDDPGLGEARKARRSRLGGDLHAKPGAAISPDLAPQPGSRSRSAITGSISSGFAAAAATRRMGDGSDPHASGHDPLGRPGGRQEGL